MQLDAMIMKQLIFNLNGIRLTTGRQYPACDKIIRCGHFYTVEQQGEAPHSYYVLMHKDTLITCDYFQEVPLTEWLNIDHRCFELKVSTSLNQIITAILNAMVSVLPLFITIHKGSNFKFEVDRAENYSVEIEIYGMLYENEPNRDGCYFYEYDDDGDAIMKTD